MLCNALGLYSLCKHSCPIHRIVLLMIIMPFISTALLMISIVVLCNGNQLPMHWNNIAYDKHSCAMELKSIRNALELNCLQSA